MAAGAILGRARDVHRQVRAEQHVQSPTQQQQKSISDTKFNDVGGGSAEAVMRR